MARVLIVAVLLLVAPPTHAGVVGASGEVQMTVRDVKYVRGNYVVTLHGRGTQRLLPIWIGQSEARAIQMRLSGARAPRPLTHDLLETVLSRLKARVVKVEVDDLRDGTYIGKLTLRGGGGTHRIDARPSDLIALAVGAGIPIHVARHVLDKAGVAPAPAVSTPLQKLQGI